MIATNEICSECGCPSKACASSRVACCPECRHGWRREGSPDLEGLTKLARLAWPEDSPVVTAEGPFLYATGNDIILLCATMPRFESALRVLAGAVATVTREEVTEAALTAVADWCSGYPLRPYLTKLVATKAAQAAYDACAAQHGLAKLQTIEEYMRNLGNATGDWSVASPVLEIISGDF